MNGDKANDGPNVVPLRTILRNFLNLVESYEARRNGGLDSYETEFQELKKLSENLKSDPGHLCKEGERTANRKKNRYKDILPYDFSRVPLRAADDAPGSDYINANFIKGASGSSAYIACQGPLPHTVNDFWRMVVECEVQVIVMACNEHESGKHKCENYWVEDDGVEREFGDVVVWLKKCRQVCPDFLVRTMRMRYKNSQGETEERNVCQFHYSAWPDHGVPTKVRPLLDMVRLIRDCQTSETLPVLVHCSAGCGRTGTICAIDYVWGLLRLGRLTAEFSLFKLVGEMRRQRIAMVQTKDQYVLVHRAVKELFQEQLRIIDSHPYANVDGNGFPVDLKADLREPTYEVLDSRPSKSLDSDKKSQCDTSNSIVVSVSSVNVSGHNGESVPAAQYTIPQRSDKEDNVTPARPSKLSGASEVVISRDRTPSKLEKRNSGTPPLPSTVASGQEAPVPGVQPDTKFEHQVSPSPTSSWDSRKSPAKVSSSGAYGILQKPFKSIFGRTAAKDDSKKTGMLPKLSRAKSDVSTRFQAFTASFGSRSGSAAPSSPVERSTKTPEKAEMKDKGKAEASNGSGETFVYNQDGKLAQVVSGVKRSKSLKITAEALAKLSGFKLDSSKNSKGKRSFTKSPSPAVSSPAPAEPAPSSSKFAPSKTDEKASKQNGYDYDIDDRSHLRQMPISPSALDRDSETKVVRVEERAPSKNGSHDKSKAKPHNYANVTLFPHGPSYRNPRSSKEMEDIDSPKKSSLDLKKKSGTVNAKMLYSSKVFPKENGYLSVFPNRRNSEKETKDPSFTLLFNNSSSSISKPNASPSTTNSTFGRTGLNDPVDHSEADGDDRIYIEAISSDVHVTSSLFGDEDSGKQESSSREGSPDKPLLRRRVPKTNPYANYPSCASGSSRYAAKIPLEKSLSDEKTVIYSDNSNSYTRDVCIPNLRTSQGGGSIGNSSTSSSSSPKNSLPSTPTQSVDILYSNVFNRSSSGGSTATSGSSHPVSSSIPARSNLVKGATVVTTGNQRPTSLLKQDETDRPGPSKQQQPINPKLNALRLGVGRSERRNSFRQAVWKEAQPSASNVDDRTASGSNSRPDGRPLYNSQAKFSVADLVPHSTAKKYEPIWPNQGAPHVETPTNGLQNGSISHKIDHGPSDKGHDVQMKIDEIKSMLEELNTTRNSPARPSEVAQAKTSVPGSSNIKQHQSLRAPSRTQYQQGLSCFTFKKPCSYESLVDAIHSEDDRSSFDLMTATGDQARVDRLQKDSSQTAMVNGKSAGERCNNEYVTLNQCRSPFEDIGRHEAHSFPENNSVPVPPPRAKRTQVNLNGTAPGDTKGWSSSKTSTDSHYAHMGSSNTTWHTQTPPSYRNNVSGPGLGPLDHDSVNVSSNPKAIIKALGLFQPKAATVRTRLESGAEARDNKAKGLSNGYTVSVDCERVDVRNTGKGGNGIVNPFAMDHDRLMSGATVLSKRQYL